jgi:hypothetical protein
MVSQPKWPKTSSATRDLIQRINRAQTAEEAYQLLLSEKRGAVIAELVEGYMYRTRRTVLLELANLRDAGVSRFQRICKGRFWRVSDGELLKVRDQLREVWSRAASLKTKQEILDSWARWRPDGFRRLGYRAWIPLLHAGRLVPEINSLHAQVVQGVLEQSRHFARCRNPNCPTPHFLARRSDQKYCERGPCTVYAQRQHALMWWNREGKKLRKSKSKARKVQKLQGQRKER